LAPEQGEALMARAQALEALGRRTEADRDWRRAWELGVRAPELEARMIEMGG
jgi:Flp pilus assembly protein TadD